MSQVITKKANALSLAKRKLVLGVGINNSDFMAEIRINGKRHVCPAYRAWKHILRRCYCDIFLSKNPTYSGVTVSDDWLLFSNFRAWWIENNVTGWQIDKDLLTDSKSYSELSCIYVPRWLNNLTEDHGMARGKYLIGACYDTRRGCFVSQCSNPEGGTAYLGSYKTQEEAHEAWKVRKVEIATKLKPEMDKIDSRIFNRVLQIIRRLK